MKEQTAADPQSATDALTGKRVVITRAPHQADELTNLLLEYGAIPVLYPCIDIAPPLDTSSLDAALLDAASGHFDWLVFTSANTVVAFSRRLGDLEIELGSVRVAAVGPKTAAAVKGIIRIDVDVIADEYKAESLATTLRNQGGGRYLLPQSNIARPFLVEVLQGDGVEVTAVQAYRTIMGQGGEDVPNLLSAGKIEAITFTSSSTVNNFLKRLVDEGGRREDLDGVCLATIGPVTADTIREKDLPVCVTPVQFTVKDMIIALASFYQSPSSIE